MLKDIKKLTPSESLDETLNFLTTTRVNVIFPITEVGLIEEMKTINIQSESGELKRILDKLHKDFYVDIEDIEEVRTTDGMITVPLQSDIIRYYSITFEGQVFNEQGGYIQKEKNARKKQRWQNAQTGAIVVGTVFAGIYGIWDIFKPLIKLLFKHFFNH